MKYLKTILFCIGVLFVIQSYGTSGGPEVLKVLGYSAEEHSVLFAYHRNNAEGLPPELWAFRLGWGELEVIEGASRYYKDGVVSKELQALKKTEIIQPEMISLVWQPPLKVNDEALEIEYKLYPVKVDFADHQFEVVQCFQMNKPIGIVEQYHYEASDLVFGVFRYFGVCMEGGYSKDTLLVSKMMGLEDFAAELGKTAEEIIALRKKQHADMTSKESSEVVVVDSESDVSSSSSATTKNDSYNLMYMLIAVMALAMVYVLLRGKNKRGNRRKNKKREMNLRK